MLASFQPAQQRGEAEDARLLLIGLPNSGKSSILQKLSGKSDQHLSIGNQKFNVRNLVQNGLHITAWDVGREAYVDPYWFDHYAERVVGLIFVVDSNNNDALVEAKEALFAALGNDRLDKVPLLVMCNKGDLADAASTIKIAEALELHELKRSTHKVVRTSAVSGEGLLPGLEWLLAQKFTRA